MYSKLKDELCEREFYDCSFIDYELRWLFIDEFMQNADFIKMMYQDMNDNQRQLYKWYIYANIHLKLSEKDRIWRYLNDDITFDLLKEHMKHGRN